MKPPQEKELAYYGKVEEEEEQEEDRFGVRTT